MNAEMPVVLQELKTDEGFVPEIGDMVLFHTKQFDRPAVITHVFDENCVNLLVFPDGTYDVHEVPRTKTSVLRGDAVEQWSPRLFEFLETIDVVETAYDSED